MQFEIEGNTYKAGKLDARTQFHIVRRLAPVFGELSASVSGKGGVEAIGPLANAIAKLSDSDADYVLFGLLKVVQREQPNGLGWGPVATADSLMYADITMATMLQIAYKCFMLNMSSFFQGLPSISQEAGQKASAT